LKYASMKAASAPRVISTMLPRAARSDFADAALACRGQCRVTPGLITVITLSAAATEEEPT